VAAFFGQAQRVKVCQQMAAHAVGADEQQRAHGIRHGGFGIRRGSDGTSGSGRLLVVFFRFRDVVGIRRGRGQDCRDFLRRRRPTCALQLGHQQFRFIAKAREQIRPAGVDACGVLGELGVNIGNVVGVGGGEET